MAHAALTSWTSPIADTMSNLVAEFKTARAKRKIYATTYAELNALSRRELNDLGINRSDIKSIAYEAAYKD